jgi:hypothetical protein
MQSPCDMSDRLTVTLTNLFGTNRARLLDVKPPRQPSPRVDSSAIRRASAPTKLVMPQIQPLVPVQSIGSLR